MQQSDTVQNMKKFIEIMLSNCELLKEKMKQYLNCSLL